MQPTVTSSEIDKNLVRVREKLERTDLYGATI